MSECAAAIVDGQCTCEADDFDPWDADHTSLVHVLWGIRHDGLTLDDFDEVASRIQRSHWARAHGLGVQRVG